MNENIFIFSIVAAFVVTMIALHSKSNKAKKNADIEDIEDIENPDQWILTIEEDYYRNKRLSERGYCHYAYNISAKSPYHEDQEFVIIWSLHKGFVEKGIPTGSLKDYIEKVNTSLYCAICEIADEKMNKQEVLFDKLRKSNKKDIGNGCIDFNEYGVVDTVNRRLDGKIALFDDDVYIKEDIIRIADNYIFNMKEIKKDNEIKQAKLKSEGIIDDIFLQ